MLTLNCTRIMQSLKYNQDQFILLMIQVICVNQQCLLIGPSLILMMSDMMNILDCGTFQWLKFNSLGTKARQLFIDFKSLLTNDEIFTQKWTIKRSDND